jgi:hypothetical protein
VVDYPVEFAVETGTRHGYLNHRDRPQFAPMIERFVGRTTTSIS